MKAYLLTMIILGVIGICAEDKPISAGVKAFAKLVQIVLVAWGIHLLVNL